MTTIAYRNKQIACDSVVLDSHGGAHFHTTKIAINPSLGVIAAAGAIGNMARLQDWFTSLTGNERVRDELCNLSLPFESFHGFLVERDGYLRSIERTKDGEAVMYSINNTHGFLAIGGGQDYAMGAMACGRNPVEAVAIARMFDSGTGGPIQWAFVDGNQIHTANEDEL